MNLSHRVLVRFLVVIVAGSLATNVWAQKPKDSKASKPAAVKSDKKAPEKPVSTDEPEDPAVAAILEAKPATPSECVRAAKSLSDLNHPDVAKRFLKKVLDAKLNATQLADLGEEFGTPLFLDMAGRAAVQPEAKQLADAVVAAVTAKLEDGKRINEWIGELQDADVEKRLKAMTALQSARSAAIAPLLQVLADPTRAAEHANVRTVLAGMGRTARDPLLAALASNDPKIQVQAIQTLAEMNNRKVSLFLLRPCVSANASPEVREAAVAAMKHLRGVTATQPEAVKMLTEAAKNYFDGREPIENEVDGRVELWRWDEAKRQCEAYSGTSADASRLLAARFAHDVFDLSPNDPTASLMYLAAMLDEAAYTNGLDKPLDEKSPAILAAKKFDVKTLDKALGFAIVRRHPAAATAIVRLLGEVGKPEELLNQGDKPAPLVLALQNPDRRLRMAALEAIVKLKPTKPFPGSSYVPAALGFFASSSGERCALVGSPSLERSRDWAGSLAAMGLHGDTAIYGAEVFRLATQSPDYELAWIDMSISRPEAEELLQQLRRDPRSASLRVALIARPGYVDDAERLAAMDPLCKAFSRSLDEKTFKWQFEQLSLVAPREFVDYKTRQQQAARSLELLAELSKISRRLFDVRRVQDCVLAALRNPKLAPKAVEVLAWVNSAESQRALVDLASRFTQPLALRQAAGKAFRENTEKYGILLTTAEIQQQYDRYNGSKEQDAATQKVLSLILDCLEAAAKRK